MYECLFWVSRIISEPALWKMVSKQEREGSGLGRESYIGRRNYRKVVLLFFPSKLLEAAGFVSPHKLPSPGSPSTSEEFRWICRGKCIDRLQFHFLLGISTISSSWKVIPQQNLFVCPCSVYWVHMFLCETVLSTAVLWVSFSLSYTNSPKTPLSPGRDCVKGQGAQPGFYTCTLTLGDLSVQTYYKTALIHLTFGSGFSSRLQVRIFLGCISR